MVTGKFFKELFEVTIDSQEVTKTVQRFHAPFTQFPQIVMKTNSLNFQIYM